MYVLYILILYSEPNFHFILEGLVFITVSLSLLLPLFLIIIISLHFFM